MLIASRVNLSTGFVFRNMPSVTYYLPTAPHKQLSRTADVIQHECRALLLRRTPASRLLIFTRLADSWDTTSAAPYLQVFIHSFIHLLELMVQELACLIAPITSWSSYWTSHFLFFKVLTKWNCPLHSSYLRWLKYKTAKPLLHGVQN